MEMQFGRTSCWTPEVTCFCLIRLSTWIPGQQKVIRVRDVTFDESSFYSPGEIDAAQLKREPFLYDTLDIPYIGPPTTEYSDSDDDLIIVRRPALPSTEASTSNKENEKEKEKEQSFLPSLSPSTVAGD